jgi:hypothetical protein
LIQYGYDPRPALPKTWSVTPLWRLLQCPLQFAYDQDRNSSLQFRRGNTFSALGNATHALEEAVHDGEFDSFQLDDLSRAIDEYWQRLIEGELDKLRAQWPEYSLPRPADLPRYSIVYCSATERARILAEARRNRLPGSGKAQIEKTLVDSHNAIEGRPDRYVVDGSTFTVIDIKSGVVSDQIQPSHRHQLLTYCHLISLETGLAPKSIAIQDIEGNLVIEDVDLHLVTAHMSDVLAAKSTFSERVQSGNSFLGDAKPGSEVCRYCNYRAICHAYWDQPPPDRQQSDIRGVVVKTSSHGFTVKRDTADMPEPEFVTVTGYRPSVEPGASVIITGGYIFRNSIKAGIGTTVFVADSV